MAEHPVYVVAQFRIHDRPRYLRYVRRFAEVLAAHGGALLAADERPEVVEGDTDLDKVVILRFDSEHRFRAWAESPQYREISADRVAATHGVVLLAHGVPAPQAPRYDEIGTRYAHLRREDPAIRDRVHAALGEARSVLNVGAGAGSYEPADRHVIAIEPSAVMAAQRNPQRAPAIRGTAEELPLFDGSVDAAMAVLSVHHWHSPERGVRELRRVARGPVVLVTLDPRVSERMWLLRDYLPEVAALDRRIFPLPEQLAGWLGGARVEPMPLARDTPDWMLVACWAHPERMLDPEARQVTSGFARMPDDVVTRVVTDLGRDLADGTWARRNAHLRDLAELDVGLRLVIAP
ncbi:DUF1330 domain-containing protein [Nocardia sp. NPDC057353]|uniref:DUF1330 domain-containing protein n=1 Tax=Nocardia sp. NPDC057353 TaxID=3346104 RepID=UPI00362DC551